MGLPWGQFELLVGASRRLFVLSLLGRGSPKRDSKVESHYTFDDVGKLDPNSRPNLDAVTAQPAPAIPAPQEYWRFQN